MDHIANIGSVSATEVNVAVGRGPHVYRTYPIKAGHAAFPAGQIVALDHNGEMVAYDAEQSVDLNGDGAAKDFSFELNTPLVPGSVTVTDGTESFTDDGFGTLIGDAGGAGKVNYASGVVSASFNAAPADAAGNVACAYKPALRGVLNRAADETAVLGDVLVMGQADRKVLIVGEVEPTKAQLLDLDRNNIWPIG